MTTTAAPPALSSTNQVSLPIDNRVEHLLLWRDPPRSGAVLGAATLAYIFLVWWNKNLVSVVAFLAAAAVVTLFVWSSLAAYLNRPGPPLPAILTQGVSEGTAKAYVETYLPYLNAALADAHHVAAGRDAVLTAKVIGGLLIVWKLGKVFSVLTWAYLVVVLAFVVPKGYEAKKREIDRAAAQLRNHTQRIHNQYVAPAMESLPRASTAVPFPSGTKDTFGSGTKQPAFGSEAKQPSISSINLGSGTTGAPFSSGVETKKAI